ncbi:MAG: N-acetylneuraminate synthase family protein, partial [Guyparkeria sp.]
MDQLDHFADGSCLVVAEVAQAHDGSLGTAHAFIDAAADAGADAVKFQTHLAEAESTPAEPWRVQFSSQDATRYDYWKRMEFSTDHWRELREHAAKVGLLFSSSPFSIPAVALLDEIDVDFFKVASGEITNLTMLDAIAETGRPVVLSTGMSPWEEIDTAVDRLRDRVALAVLQCTSEYPCPPERVGLNVIEQLRDRYHVPVGLSDHSGTIFPGLAAVTARLAVLEVHLTLSRRMFGPDVPASVTTEELTTLVDGVRFIERAVANPVQKDHLVDGFTQLRSSFMRSPVTARPLDAGHRLTEVDITLKKPGTGLPPDSLPQLLGRSVVRALPADHQLSMDDLAE